MIDFHNHLLPAVDDGAADLDQARAALEAFRAQGATAVIVTPHARASATTSAAERDRFLRGLEPAWEMLAAMARAEFPDVRLERGVELALDALAPELDDPRLRLAGTAYVLVEFPYMSVPPHAGQVLYQLGLRGWTPVVAHPERYANLGAEPLRGPADWRRGGARLQLNAGSLLGRYGSEPRRIAWMLLEGGLADYLCSDYHARGTLHSAAARAVLEAAGGAEQARLLMDENPARLLAGEPPLPVHPLALKRGLLSRLFGRG